MPIKIWFPGCANFAPGQTRKFLSRRTRAALSLDLSKLALARTPTGATQVRSATSKPGTSSPRQDAGDWAARSLSLLKLGRGGGAPAKSHPMRNSERRSVTKRIADQVTKGSIASCNIGSRYDRRENILRLAAFNGSSGALLA